MYAKLGQKPNVNEGMSFNDEILPKYIKATNSQWKHSKIKGYAIDK